MSFDPCSPGLLAQQRLGARTLSLSARLSTFLFGLKPLLGLSPVLQNRQAGAAWRCTTASNPQSRGTTPLCSSRFAAARLCACVIKVGCSRRAARDVWTAWVMRDGRRQDMRKRRGMHCSSAHLGAKRHKNPPQNRTTTKDSQSQGWNASIVFPNWRVPFWG